MITRRCSERRFFMRPDDRTNNAFIYCLGLAAQKYGVNANVPNPSPSPGLRAVSIMPAGIVPEAVPLRIADGSDVTAGSSSGDGVGHSLLAYAAFDPNTTASQTRVVTRLLTVAEIDGGLPRDG